MIPYGHHWIDESDIAGVADALRAELITQGSLIDRFEERLAAYCGARFAVAMSSGTAALHAACFAAGIGMGDEAVTSPLTFVGTANAVIYQGGVPVFADIDERTLNIDPQAIAARITPRTKAIIPVHFGGLPCDLARIQAIAQAHRLMVIEDACHALGAVWRTPDGRQESIGSCSHSDMTVLSFHPVKHITTGEGGMVLTNREELRDRLRLFRHHGLRKVDDMDGGAEEPWRSEMCCLGYNYRITDFQCGLGLKQLEKLGHFLQRRQAIATVYHQAFATMGCAVQPVPEGTRHAWHLYVLRLPAGTDRRAVFDACQAQGVGVNVHYLPVHLHAFYRERFGHRPGAYPAAERYYESAITLPLFPRMSDADVERVIGVVRTILGKSRESWMVAASVGAPVPMGGGS